MIVFKGGWGKLMNTWLCKKYSIVWLDSDIRVDEFQALEVFIETIVDWIGHFLQIW